MKFLIISIYYPPWQTIASIRAAAMAKHLSQCGHEVAIMTLDEQSLPMSSKNYNFFRSKEQIREIRIAPGSIIPHGLLTKKGTQVSFFRKALRKIITYWTPDAYYFWALRSAKTFIKKSGFIPNVVFSTALPFSSHHAGMLIAGYCKAFWVADFRDLWIGNPYESDTERARKRKFSNYQKHTLASADLITCISSEMAQVLKETIGLPERVKVLRNAFDDDEMIACSDQTEQNTKFTLLYTGAIYRGYRDFSCLFSALRRIAHNPSYSLIPFKIQYAGPDGAILRAQAVNYKMENIIEDLGYIPRQDVLRRQRSADGLLISIGKGGANDAMVVTGKIFEYLAAHRPVLGLGYENGSLGSLLQETKVGSIYSPENIDGLQKHLELWFEEWDKNGQLSYKGDMEMIMRHSWGYRVQEFLSMIEILEFQRRSFKQK